MRWICYLTFILKYTLFNTTFGFPGFCKVFNTIKWLSKRRKIQRLFNAVVLDHEFPLIPYSSKAYAWLASADECPFYVLYPLKICFEPAQWSSEGQLTNHIACNAVILHSALDIYHLLFTSHLSFDETWSRKLHCNS